MEVNPGETPPGPSARTVLARPPPSSKKPGDSSADVDDGGPQRKRAKFPTSFDEYKNNNGDGGGSGGGVVDVEMKGDVEVDVYSEMKVVLSSMLEELHSSVKKDVCAASDTLPLAAPFTGIRLANISEDGDNVLLRFPVVQGEFDSLVSCLKLDLKTTKLELYPEDFWVDNPTWHVFVEEVLSPVVQAKLGITYPINMKLEKLVMHKVGFSSTTPVLEKRSLPPPNDSDETYEEEGTLIIQFPSKYNGGHFSVTNDYGGTDFHVSGEETKEWKHYYFAFGNGLKEKYKKVSDGLRCWLVYRLQYKVKNENEEVKKSDKFVQDETQLVKWISNDWSVKNYNSTSLSPETDSPSKLIIMMSEPYPHLEDLTTISELLKPADSVIAGFLCQLAQENNLTLLIANMHNLTTRGSPRKGPQSKHYVASHLTFVFSADAYFDDQLLKSSEKPCSLECRMREMIEAEDYCRTPKQRDISDSKGTVAFIMFPKLSIFSVLQDIDVTGQLSAKLFMKKCDALKADADNDVLRRNMQVTAKFLFSAFDYKNVTASTLQTVFETILSLNEPLFIPDLIGTLCAEDSVVHIIPPLMAACRPRGWNPLEDVLMRMFVILKHNFQLSASVLEVMLAFETDKDDETKLKHSTCSKLAKIVLDTTTSLKDIPSEILVAFLNLLLSIRNDDNILVIQYLNKLHQGVTVVIPTLVEASEQYGWKRTEELLTLVVEGRKCHLSNCAEILYTLVTEFIDTKPKKEEEHIKRKTTYSKLVSGVLQFIVRTVRYAGNDVSIPKAGLKQLFQTTVVLNEKPLLETFVSAVKDSIADFVPEFIDACGKFGREFVDSQLIHIFKGFRQAKSCCSILQQLGANCKQETERKSYCKLMEIMLTSIREKEGLASSASEKIEIPLVQLFIIAERLGFNLLPFLETRMTFTVQKAFTEAIGQKHCLVLGKVWLTLVQTYLKPGNNRLGWSEEQEVEFLSGIWDIATRVGYQDVTKLLETRKTSTIFAFLVNFGNSQKENNGYPKELIVLREKIAVDLERELLMMALTSEWRHRFDFRGCEELPTEKCSDCVKVKKFMEGGECQLILKYQSDHIAELIGNMAEIGLVRSKKAETTLIVMKRCRLSESEEREKMHQLREILTIFSQEEEKRKMTKHKTKSKSNHRISPAPK